MTDLNALLYKFAYLTGTFTTRAGNQTNYYIDKYRFSTRPDILSTVADHIVDLLPALDQFDRLAAPELGAVPIATAVSLRISKPFIIIKKSSKSYGTQKKIEGVYSGNDRIVMLEDVIATGGAVLDACQVAVQAGLTIQHIIAVVNRNEGGVQAIKNRDYSVDYVTTVAAIQESNQESNITLNKTGV